MRIAYLSILVGLCIFIAGCRPKENTGTVQQPIIAGDPVNSDTQKVLGLVGVSATRGQCSGSLLSDSWVLTAGHCFADGARPQTATVSFPAEIGPAGIPVQPTRDSDRVYVMGRETKDDGKSNTRGFDLAFIHLATPWNAFTQKPILDHASLKGKPIDVYGQGISSYFNPGPPPVPPSGFGSYRHATLSVTKAVSQVFLSLDNQIIGPWPDRVIATNNAAGQICAPGDSGGPVFVQDGNQTWLAGVQVSGNWKCVNNSSDANCRATITAITDCQANTLPKHMIEDVMKIPWDQNASTQVFDVSEELGTSGWLFTDPSRVTEIDTNLRSWDVSARTADELCFNRGFIAGRMNGNQGTGRWGIVCSSAGAFKRDAVTADMALTQWRFADVTNVGWAQANRAAADICQRENHGFVGGHFNGFQALGGVGEPRPIKFGLVCFGAPAQFFDASANDIQRTNWPVGDVNTVGWAQASRAAMQFCESKGFLTGFMNGNQVPGRYGVVCQK